MSTQFQSRSRSRFRYESPPPTRTMTHRLEQLGQHVLWALEDMLEEISTMHRILLCYLVIVGMVIEWLRQDHADTLLSILLGMVQLAVVIDSILIVTHHLMRLAVSNRTLAIIVSQMPFVTGPLAEFELTRLMLTGNSATTANTFLVGCVYAKPLAAGALCLALHNLHTGGPGMQPYSNRLMDVSKVFLRSGALIVLSTHGIKLDSLPGLMAAAGDSPWLSRGVPVLLLLSIGFTCYFWYWHAEKYRDIVSKRYNTHSDSEWLVLLVCLVALKLFAAHLVHRVWKQMESAAWTAEQDTGSVVQFAILPLAVTVVDHLADISVSYRGDMYWPWASLCQSSLQTLFFIRPLFMLAGHDIDPQSGRIGIALCFLGIALWLSVPSHSLLGGVSSDGR
ncbi:hypothetical protein J3E74DRAFT_295609 [Bipolaris maydis]|nr:hypothetical protein J3E74DRAFT_295609 [Bipolaris maydis]